MSSIWYEPKCLSIDFYGTIIGPTLLGLTILLFKEERLFCGIYELIDIFSFQG